MTSKLTSSIRTRSEADEIVGEIQMLKNSLYEDGDRSFESTLKSNIRFWVADIIREEIRDLGKDTEKYLEKLVGEISSLEEFKITLAFEPSDKGINMFLDYLRESVDKSLILEIEHDPKILGGTIISYKGNYHDYSLFRIFDEEFEENRAEIISVLQNTE